MHLAELILEIYIQLLIVNGIVIVGKGLILRDIDPKLYLSNYDTNVNKYKIKCGTSLRFWENKGWIREQDPYGWFQWYC